MVFYYTSFQTKHFAAKMYLNITKWQARGFFELFFFFAGEKYGHTLLSPFNANAINYMYGYFNIIFNYFSKYFLCIKLLNVRCHLRGVQPHLRGAAALSDWEDGCWGSIYHGSCTYAVQANKT